MRVGLVALAVNFVLSVALAWALTVAGIAGTHAGLALATSVAAVVNAWLLYRGLHREQMVELSPRWRILLVRFAVANAAMTACLVWMQRSLDWWIDADVFERSLRLGLEIGAGVLVYFAVLAAVGARAGDFRLNRDRAA